MNLVKAQVVSNRDDTRSGKFWAYSDHIGEDPVLVTLTSPYYFPGKAGFIAIPPEGSMILIMQSSEGQWYFQGNIVEFPEGGGQTDNVDPDNRNVIPRDSMYQGRNRPQQISLSDPKNNELLLSSKYSPEEMFVGALLRSSNGKRLLLSDSPKADCIILRNEHGDRLALTSQETEALAARCMELMTRGPVLVTSRESGIELRVVDGRELDIKNSSTGLNQNPGQTGRFGNINIESTHSDINITTREVDGKVFIDALGTAGLIQIDSAGSVTINATTGPINFITEGQINFEGRQGINFNSQGPIQFNTTQNIAMQGTAGFSSLTGGVASIDGATVHFNSGLSQPPIIPPLQPKEDNAYGD